MRIIGLDYGEKRVGVAIGDTITRLASPRDVWKRQDDASIIGRLQELCHIEQVSHIVVGVPHPLSDQTRETDQTKTIRGFITCLRVAGFVVVEENETWSSAIAARQTREMEKKGKRDDLAAAVILQTYLDRNPHAVSP